MTIGVLPSDSDSLYESHVLADILRFQTPATGWEMLPAWARFYLRLGRQLGRRSPNGPVVAALVAPTRAYATVLLAAGIVGDRAMCPPELDTAFRLEELARLVPTHPVVVYKPTLNVRRLCTLLACGETGVRLREPRGLETTVPLKDVLKIELPKKQLKELPKQTVSKHLNKNIAFIRSAFGLGATAVARYSRLECVLVGSEASLKLELDNAVAIQPLSGKCVQGRIQDIVRARCLTKDAESFRSDLVSSSPAAAEPPSDVYKCKTVLFDGAAAFLRSRDRWPSADWIVVMDRGEPSYGDAVDEVEQLWETRGTGEEIPLPTQLPPSLECSVFAVRS